MSLSEDEKSLLVIKYDLQRNSLRERFDNDLIEIKHSDLMGIPVERFYKKARENYLKSILEFQVQSFIDLFKMRVNNIPDDIDIKFLSNKLKEIVDAQINEHLKWYKNSESHKFSEKYFDNYAKNILMEWSFLIGDCINSIAVYKLTTKIRENEIQPESNFDGILSIIQNAMISQARNPISFNTEDENSYRNFLIAVINAHYKFLGKAVAEAINDRGKTDIQVLFDEKNRFIAECKIWGKDFLETINQLLNYSTYYEQNAAIIIFSKIKKFSTVITAIKSKVREHPKFLSVIAESDDVLNYSFSHPKDESAKIQISILSFNIYRPKIEKKQ